MAQLRGKRPGTGADPTLMHSRRRRHSRLARMAAVVLAVAATTGVLSPLPANASPTTSTVYLQNLVTGLCADLPDTGPGQPDAPVTQYDCRYSNDNQRWHLEPHGTSGGRQAYLIKNDLGGCMDLPDYGVQKAGTPMSLYGCRPENDNQLFVALPTELPGVYKFAHALDQNLCLDVAGRATGGNDARLTLWTCSDTDDHLWLLRRSEADRTGASFGIVATAGAALRLRAEPRADSSRRGALANHTPFQIQCVAGRPGDQWYRTASGRYISATYVKRRGPAVPACGGGPAESLTKVFEHAADYSDANAAWATLGVDRQNEQAWRNIYGSTLKRIAENRALDAIGINDGQVSKWKPEDPLPSNDSTVQAVYTYYGHLYGQRPELLWAGMAKLAGAAVYAGMQDAEYAWVPQGKDVSRALREMQKAIFVDLAWQHQLYVDRGLPALERVNDAGLLGDAGARNASLVDGSIALISAWRDIASGDQSRIDRGNRVLITREQDPVLQPYYDKLAIDHTVWIFGTSRFGRSPIPPGTNKFWDTTPPGHRVVMERSSPTAPKVPVRMPNSYHQADLTFSIAFWEDRQKWVYGHLLPDYLDRLKTDPQGMHYQIVDRTVKDRADTYRNLSTKKVLNYMKYGPPVGLIF